MNVACTLPARLALPLTCVLSAADGATSTRYLPDPVWMKLPVSDVVRIPPTPPGAKPPLLVKLPLRVNVGPALSSPVVSLLKELLGLAITRLPVIVPALLTAMLPEPLTKIASPVSPRNVAIEPPGETVSVLPVPKLNATPVTPPMTALLSVTCAEPVEPIALSTEIPNVLMLLLVVIAPLAVTVMVPLFAPLSMAAAMPSPNELIVLAVTSTLPDGPVVKATMPALLPGGVDAPPVVMIWPPVMLILTPPVPPDVAVRPSPVADSVPAVMLTVASPLWPAAITPRNVVVLSRLSAVMLAPMFTVTAPFPLLDALTPMPLAEMTAASTFTVTVPLPAVDAPTALSPRLPEDAARIVPPTSTRMLPVLALELAPARMPSSAAKIVPPVMKTSPLVPLLSATMPFPTATVLVPIWPPVMLTRTPPVPLEMAWMPTPDVDIMPAVMLTLVRPFVPLASTPTALALPAPAVMSAPIFTVTVAFAKLFADTPMSWFRGALIRLLTLTMTAPFPPVPAATPVPRTGVFVGCINMGPLTSTRTLPVLLPAWTPQKTALIVPPAVTKVSSALELNALMPVLLIGLLARPICPPVTSTRIPPDELATSPFPPRSVPPAMLMVLRPAAVVVDTALATTLPVILLAIVAVTVPLPLVVAESPPCPLDSAPVPLNTMLPPLVLVITTAVVKLVPFTAPAPP